MNVGDQVRLHLIKRVSDKKARVIEVTTGAEGILLIKGELRIRKDGTVSAWVMPPGPRDDSHLFGNAFFGKFSILESTSGRYTSIIKKLFDNPETLLPEDISTLKGMCNRCIKRDQWDWFTTLQYLGYPSITVLRSFVAEAIRQRDHLRAGRFDELTAFRERFELMLSSMLFHLSEDLDVEEADLDIPIPLLESILWSRMSSESRKNIKFAERIHGKFSRYLLMHYFVTLEQEFNDHFVQPFLEHTRAAGLQPTCTQERYQRTHDLLTGKSPLTLGSISFLGELSASRRACQASQAIQGFAEFLGHRAENFATLCALISKVEVSGISLPKLRNGLAHGDRDVVGRLDAAAFGLVRGIMFEAPHRLLYRVLTLSLKS